MAHTVQSFADRDVGMPILIGPLGPKTWLGPGLFESRPLQTDNRLRHVNDAGGIDPTWDDLEDQGSYTATDPSSWNYAYDASGNLIKDKAEEIEQILWTITGKVSQVIRTATSTKPDLEFIYDPMGNRIGKTVKGKDAAGNLLTPDTWKHTWYLRDAQGNHLSTYATTGDLPTEVLLEDQLIYGSKRRKRSVTSIFWRSKQVSTFVSYQDQSSVKRCNWPIEL